jgi:hypothetical protein
MFFLDENGGPVKVAPVFVETGNERILLIDDEQMTLEVVRQMIEHLGYTVTTAEKIRQALGKTITGDGELKIAERTDHRPPPRRSSDEGGVSRSQSIVTDPFY